MNLSPALEPGVALVEEGPLTLETALEQLADRAGSALQVPPRDLLLALRAREEIRSTAMGDAVALPHAILPGLPRTLVVPMLVRRGALIDPSQPPCTLIIGLFGDISIPWNHVKMLARLARIVSDPHSIAVIRAATDPDDLVARLLVEDQAHA